MKTKITTKTNPLLLGRFAIECVDEVVDKDGSVLAPAAVRIKLADGGSRNITPLCTTTKELKFYIEDAQLTVGRLFRMVEQFLPAVEQHRISAHLVYDDEHETEPHDVGKRRAVTQRKGNRS